LARNSILNDWKSVTEGKGALRLMKRAGLAEDACESVREDLIAECQGKEAMPHGPICSIFI
jgi:hypothetical protein